MTKCELCNKVARMYCQSDRASLCFDCDSRVHTANFIVAKHKRTLLCHSCYCFTAWTGSGPQLGTTVSLCEACVGGRNCDEDDDVEVQVVPLSLPPPFASSSSSSNDSSGRRDATTVGISAKKIKSWRWR